MIKRIIKNNLNKKLKTNRGESMVETLISIMVLTFVFVMLSNTLVAVSKGNSAVLPEDTAFHYNGEKLTSEKVKITINGVTSEVSGYSVYKTDNDYYYYMNE